VPLDKTEESRRGRVARDPRNPIANLNAGNAIAASRPYAPAETSTPPLPECLVENRREYFPK